MHYSLLCPQQISVKYSHRAKVVTFICWAVLSMNILLSIYLIFVVVNGQFNDETLLFYTTFDISRPFAYIAIAVSIILQVHAVASCLFPQAIIIFCALYMT